MEKYPVKRQVGYISSSTTELSQTFAFYILGFGLVISSRTEIYPANLLRYFYTG